MTRYKQYMKKHLNMKFNEDCDVLPFPVDNDGVMLENRDAFVTPYGILIVSIYNIDTVRWLYLSNGKCLAIYDEDDVLKCEKPCEIRIYHDLPHYKFLFDDNDNLIAVRYTKRDFS